MARSKVFAQLAALCLLLAVWCLFLSGSAPGEKVSGPAQGFSGLGQEPAASEPGNIRAPHKAVSKSTTVSESNSISEPTAVSEPNSVSELKTDAMLAVDNILQYPELPNGCEGTSLAIVLNYFGIEADKYDIAMNYVPRMAFADGGGHPDAVYMGDPSSYYGGYYCFPAPLAAAAAQYLEEHSSPLCAYVATGSTEADLIAFLNADLPVIVWITVDNRPPVRREDLAWMLTDTGAFYVPYVNLHVAVLRGYDAENFYLCDPLDNIDTLPREDFMALYTAMGRRAMVVRPPE